MIGFGRLVAVAYDDPAYCCCRPRTNHRLRRHVTSISVLGCISMRTQRHDGISFVVYIENQLAYVRHFRDPDLL